MFADSRLSPLPHVPARAPAMPPALRVGLIGMGTVGTGVWRVLRRNQGLIAARAGRAVEIVAVATRTPARAAAAQAEAPGLRLLDDPLRLAADPGVDVLLELAGGSAARDWVLAALAQGKHVVTANKALLADAWRAAGAGRRTPWPGAGLRGRRGRRGTRDQGAARGPGGQPHRRPGRRAQRHQQLHPDAHARRRAWTLPPPWPRPRPWATPRPTRALDVDGTDAAHKLTLLAANAFGLPPALDAVHVEGLRDLQPGDMAAAAQLGYVVKLLAIARRGVQGMELRVHPALVPAQHALARLDGASNGLLVRADAARRPSSVAPAQAASPRPRPCSPTWWIWHAAPRHRWPLGRPDRHTHPGPTRGRPRRPLPMAQVRTRQLLRLLPGQDPVRGQVLRQLAHAGVKVERRAWGPAEAAPRRVAQPAAADRARPDGLAAQAARALCRRTRAPGCGVCAWSCAALPRMNNKNRL